MKKLRFPGLFLILVSFSLMIISCKKSSDNTTPADPKPVMTFKTGTGYISTDATVPTGSGFKFGIQAISSTATGSKLTNFKIVRTFNNKPEDVYDSSFSVPSFNAEINCYARTVAGTEKWTFTLTSQDNQVTEVSILITTHVVYGPITEYTGKILGAQHSSNGSFFSTFDGIIYNLADAKNHSEAIDLVYFNDSNHLASLSAPSDSVAMTIFNSDTAHGIPSWQVRNPTAFKKVAGSINWASIWHDSILIAETNIGVIDSKESMLVKNEILAFITISGKRGFIRIDDISGADAGTITFSVKIQKTSK